MTCIDAPGTRAFDDLIQLALSARPAAAPTWQSPGIKAAIRNMCASERKFTFAELTRVVITAAMNADARTPAVIEHDGSWGKTTPASTKVYGWDEGDPRYVCAECSLDEPSCRARAHVNGHEFKSRMEHKPTRVTKADVELTATAPPPEPQGLDELLTRRPELAEAARVIAENCPGLREMEAAE